MSDIKDGGQAFPHGWQMRHNLAERYVGGMSLRDYFAGQYIAGYAARGPIEEFERAALNAYDLADALLKEREQ